MFGTTELLLKKQVFHFLFFFKKNSKYKKMEPWIGFYLSEPLDEEEEEEEEDEDHDSEEEEDWTLSMAESEEFSSEGYVGVMVVGMGVLYLSNFF